MINVSISGSSIDIIQSKKSLFGKNEIIASVRKELPEGVVVNGLVQDVEKFVLIFQEALKTSYPKAIKDKVLSIAIPDENLYLKRFEIEVLDKKTDISKIIIEKAKNEIQEELANYESYYKRINDTTVLYTGVKLTTVAHYLELAKRLNLDLKCLTTKIFSHSSLLYPLINEQDLFLYTSVQKDSVEFSLIDRFGPKLFAQKKHGSKTLETEFKSYIKILKEKPETTPTRVIIGGKDAPEIHSAETTEAIALPIAKSNEIIDGLLQKIGIRFSTSGESVSLYGTCIGLLLVSSDSNTANFVSHAAELPTITSQAGTSVIPEIKKEDKESAKPKIVDDVLKKSLDTKETDIEPTDKKEIQEPIKKNSESEDSGKSTEVKSVDSSSVLKSVDISQVKRSEPVAEMEIKDSVPHQLLASPIVEYKKSFLQALLDKKALIIGFIGIFIIVGLVLWAVGGQKSGAFPFMAPPTPTPTIIPSPTITPSPTVDPDLKRTDVKISVQNGTDKTGYAKEIADSLEKKGYKNIDKRNADKDDYPSTIIKVKETKKSYGILLQKDLSNTFETSIESLDSSDAFDVIVILGKN